jgi:hypothetical protein
MPAFTDGAGLTPASVQVQLRNIAHARAQELGIQPDEMDYASIGGNHPPLTKDQAWALTLDTACFYTHSDRPGCIVGQWLVLNGVTLDELAQQEGENADDVVVRFMPAVPTDVLEFLMNVQSYQDSGEKWLAAIKDGSADLKEED